MFSDNKKTDDHQLALYTDMSKFESLGDYIQQWAGMFEGKGMGLTTPVTIRTVNDDNAKGAQILFLKVQTGYKDKDKDEDDGGGGSPKDEQEKEVKQGGVEVLVEKLPDDSVQVRVQRCEMDDETMIKEMSEETILKELKKAMEVWKKQH